MCRTLFSREEREGLNLPAREQLRLRLKELGNYKVSELEPMVLDSLIGRIEEEYKAVEELANGSILKVKTDLQARKTLEDWPAPT